jgi:hypothetical protein
MGLFGKKNGADLHTLSEKEIQLKLYGHLRTPHAPVQDDSAPAQEFSKPSNGGRIHPSPLAGHGP